MDVALKIWRYDPESGERVLREYEVDAPDWACLLDVLDLIKDTLDGCHFAYFSDQDGVIYTATPIR